MLNFKFDIAKDTKGEDTQGEKDWGDGCFPAETWGTAGFLSARVHRKVVKKNILQRNKHKH